MEIKLLSKLLFLKRKLFALWILFTLSSLPGLFKCNILFLNILLFLIGIKSVSMKKSRKKMKNKIIENLGFIMKVDVERFGYYNLLRGFKLMKSVVKVAIDV